MDVSVFFMCRSVVSKRDYWLFALFRDDVDDTVHGIRAAESTGRVADNLDVVDIGHVVDAATIDEDQDLIVVRAAQADIIIHGTLRDVEACCRLESLC